jgi:hypothetical protein
MGRTRKVHSAVFKAKVALAAARRQWERRCARLCCRRRYPARPSAPSASSEIEEGSGTTEETAGPSPVGSSSESNCSTSLSIATPSSR